MIRIGGSDRIGGCQNTARLLHRLSLSLRPRRLRPLSESNRNRRRIPAIYMIAHVGRSSLQCPVVSSDWPRDEITQCPREVGLHRICSGVVISDCLGINYLEGFEELMRGSDVEDYRTTWSRCGTFPMLVMSWITVWGERYRAGVGGGQLTGDGDDMTALVGKAAARLEYLTFFRDDRRRNTTGDRRRETTGAGGCKCAATGWLEKFVTQEGTGRMYNSIRLKGL